MKSYDEVYGKKLTPQDYINYFVLYNLLEDEEGLSLKGNIVLDLDSATEITENLQEYVIGTEYPEDYFIDELNCFRESGEECNLYSNQSSRHYEEDYVVHQIEDKWIGWTYWHGGGKHGEPEAIDWMSDAEFVEVDSEEVVTVVQRVFKRK